MRYSFLFTLLFISLTNLAAQDSLRLTIKLDGFKDKNELRIAFSEGQFNFPTDKEEVTLIRKLNGPELMSFYYKNKYQSFWIENNDIEVYIPKSGFAGGVVATGSTSQALWDSILEASQEEKARILEENIDSKVVLSYIVLP